MHKIIEFIINLIIKKPILCLGASAFLFLICIPGAQFIKRDHSPEIWFRTDDPLITQLREFEAKFGNDESIIIALNDEKGIFNKKTLETLFLLTKELWLIPGVLRVDSLTNNSHSHSKNDELIIQPYFPDSLNEFQALGQEEIITIEKMAMNDDVVLDYLVDK